MDDIKAEIRRIVTESCPEHTHRQCLLDLLRQPGFASHPDSACRSGVVCYYAYHTISRASPPAIIRASAAVELFIEAGFLFDAVADQEISQEWGITASEALAFAITLLNCGASAATSAANELAPGYQSLAALKELYTACISACAGQFLDAHTENVSSVTSEDALIITGLKSGSCGRLAASFGAGLATGDDGLVRLYSELGYNLFTYQQLTDDLKDAFRSEVEGDGIKLKKKTLPLVYFYIWMNETNRNSGDGIIKNSVGIDTRYLKKLYDDSGANVFGTVIAETFLNRAKENVMEISSRIGEVDELNALVHSFQHTPRLVVA